MKAWPHMTKDQLVKRFNALGYYRLVKVLLFEHPGQEESASEGVWVLIADGTQNSGIGVLLSNAVSLGGDQPARGDVVEYRTITPAHKPYIVNWADGQGN
jgi:hypothetical protein